MNAADDGVIIPVLIPTINTAGGRYMISDLCQQVVIVTQMLGDGVA